VSSPNTTSLYSQYKFTSRYNCFELLCMQVEGRIEGDDVPGCASYTGNNKDLKLQSVLN
jgi:hypothetical protein